MKLRRLSLPLLGIAVLLVLPAAPPASAAPVRSGNDYLEYDPIGGRIEFTRDNCIRHVGQGNLIVLRWFTRGQTPLRCIQTAKINLVFQTDGNLVVYRRAAPSGPVW